MSDGHSTEDTTSSEHNEPSHPPAAAEIENTYEIRPNFQHKFRAAPVKKCISAVLSSKLTGVEYSDIEDIHELTNEITNSIQDKVKELEYARYKFIVQVVIAEQKGEAIKMACRCFWDSDTDSYTHDIFMNDSMFCMAAVFGVFFY